MKCKHENKWEHFLIRTPLSAVLFYTRIWDENIFKKKITEYSKKKKNSEKVQYMGNSGKVEFQDTMLK